MSKTTLSRFVSKIDMSGECWEWLGTKTKAGYGTFTPRSYTSTTGCKKTEAREGVQRGGGEVITIKLDGIPVSANAMYSKNWQKGSKRKSDAYKSLEKLWTIQTRLQSDKMPVVDQLTPLEVDVYCQAPREQWYTKAGTIRKNGGDADNFLKVSLDIVSRALKFDDSIFMSVGVHKVVVDGPEQTIVKIRKWTG